MNEELMDEINSLKRLLEEERSARLRDMDLISDNFDITNKNMINHFNVIKKNIFDNLNLIASNQQKTAKKIVDNLTKLDKKITTQFDDKKKKG